MRRTGRQEDSQTRLWRVVDTATGLSLSGLWRTERDLEVLLPALAGCAGPLSDPAEMVLVCTHGVRDACCAIKGRPIAGAVAKALASSDVEVLECSHLNGHRFAGTALTLPDGLCYGRLDQSDAPKVMKAHAEGRVWPDKLRGQTGLVGAAQAAHVWGLRTCHPHREHRRRPERRAGRVRGRGVRWRHPCRTRGAGQARRGHVGGRASRGPRARSAVVRQVAESARGYAVLPRPPAPRSEHDHGTLTSVVERVPVAGQVRPCVAALASSRFPLMIDTWS